MSLPVHLAPDLGAVRPGATVVLEGDEAHHAVAVRRTRVGERLVLTDGRGVAATVSVAATGKRRLEVVVADVERSAAPEPSLTVVQALPKGDRGELAVEVLTEVGAARIVPWAAERCVATWRGERRTRGEARWAAAAREAAKQARRPWHPVVDPLADTATVADLVGGAALGVVLHEAASRPLAALAVPERGDVVVVVGPEGGLTDDEVGRLAEASGVPCRLGAEVLRTSTAGLAAAASLLSRTARWGG